MDHVRESDEDARWREIVDNYGDRAELAEEELRPEEPPRADPPVVSPSLEPGHLESGRLPDDEAPERFVPPPAPPIPRPAPRRLIAWAGLFGAPLLLLATLVLGTGVPTLLSYALVAWFVGGFVYLVIEMPRGPRDPGDDGAQV